MSCKCSEVLLQFLAENEIALTPLIIAIQKNKLNSFNKLLSLGADPEGKVDNLLPLMYAIRCSDNQVSFCKALVKNNADTSILKNVINKHGEAILGKLGVLKNIDEIANIICKTEKETNDSYIEDNANTLVENKDQKEKKENSDNLSYDVENSDEIDSVDATGEESNNNDF